MAASSTCLPPPSPVVLPSIHDILRGHLPPHTPPSRATPAPRLFPPIRPPSPSRSTHTVGATNAAVPLFSFPNCRSNQDADTENQPSTPPHPAVRRTPSPSSTISSSNAADEEPADVDLSYSGEIDAAGGASPRPRLSVDGVNSARKHVCSNCNKRFTRPSSLQIHLNTHTGAMPFHCPYPACGRSFNVNSNMRRHFRNHANHPYGHPQRRGDSSSPGPSTRGVRGSGPSPQATSVVMPYGAFTAPVVTSPVWNPSPFIPGHLPVPSHSHSPSSGAGRSAAQLTLTASPESPESVSLPNSERSSSPHTPELSVSARPPSDTRHESQSPPTSSPAPRTETSTLKLHPVPAWHRYSESALRGS